jgi:hypothetical protein
MVDDIARSVAGRVSTWRPDAVLERVRDALRQGGVDLDQLPVRVQQQLSEEAAQALRGGGDLNPAAMTRLADFARVEGATPTRGMLTQDPGQVSREMNLAKQQANTANLGDARNLSQVQADNNAALIRSLNAQGANTADDAYTAGQRVIDALEQNVSAQKSNIDGLYAAARDSSGRSFPLDGYTFTNRAAQLLDDALVSGSLPEQVRGHLNRIAKGEVPFTVDYSEQLKTAIAGLQRRATDGNMRHALGLVRQALDDTPILPLGEQTAAAGARAVNPGNLPAVAGDATLGEEAVAAFNQARGAHRSLMQQAERTPALKAVLDGAATPDQFMQKYLLGAAAKAKDVQAMKEAIAADPAVGETIRSHITSWLKNKALGGAADETGRFSASNYNKALQSIGRQNSRRFSVTTKSIS